VHAVAENQSGEQKAVDGDEKYKRSGYKQILLSLSIISNVIDLHVWKKH